MKLLNVKGFVIAFAIGMLIGFLIPSLFNGGNEVVTIPSAPVIPPKELKEQADKTEAKYHEQIVVLENRNKLLEKDLGSTKSQLELAKQKARKRETTIKHLIEPQGMPAKELLQIVQATTLADTSQSPCDSLKQEVTAYMEEAVVKENLYERETSTLDSMITSKDGIITAQRLEKEELNTVMQQSLSQLEQQLNENKTLKKQIKRQKFRNTLKTIGLMIVSGAATYYLNHH